MTKSINVRISEEKRAKMEKWGERATHKGSAVVRLFIDKCLEFCDGFTWEEFKRAKIVPGNDPASERRTLGRPLKAGR